MISLIIPIYNEEEGIDMLFEKVTNALTSITNDYEIVCVDDGSADKSLKKMLAYHEKDQRFKVLALSRNFGHQAAYTAGMNHAKGDYIVLMDGDLQDPPELIKEMFEKAVSENLDVVYAKRISRKEGFVKRMLIKLFHYIYYKTSNIHAPINVGNFCCINRKALNSLLSLNEKNRYLPGLRFFIGYKQGFVEYSRPQREHGATKMSTSKLFKLALDAIFSFSNLPLKFCLYIGILGIIISLIAGAFSLISKILGLATPGWSSILLSIYFFGSVQLIFLGVVGEYVHRIYTETQNRPLFIIDRFYD